MLIPISNTPRDYSWGSVDLIPALEGREPTGRPEAEVWYGDHPGCPSVVAGGSGQTLDEALAAAGEQPLPFLLKVLAAASSLSIQAHPTIAQARESFAREEDAGVPRDAADRLYRDANHKPEIIVALSDEFRALVGIRPLDDTRRLVAALGEGPARAALMQRLGAPVGAEGADGAATGADAAAPASVVRDLLAWALTDADADLVADLVRALERADSDEFAEEIATLRAAAADFPGDPGLIVALLMNLVILRPGQALFAPAGVLHAYQSGLGVELMAASDNVLRGGLTPKHVDVPELMRVVDVATGPAPLVVPQEIAPGVREYAPPVSDFALTAVTVTADQPVTVALRGPAIVLATAGEVEVRTADAVVSLVPGAAVYVGREDRVEVSGAGAVFVAQPGRA
ncbi:mannose-6-phosphate isomerase, class I [Microbacterium aurum]|uniref:mannose-6-phosphate isomerase n=1 Tax=Microbacterium aurum TaxID=36805 RepID=A0A1P8UA71_9MICO|nr:mannose-6-phosphate isomerase, class I [Microbacterium aurum]APZ35019.1 mannose-6-phosphate isomerase, class I [Microbacterium aurum]MBM7828967.1 mannose-6-phosphate isomerase [Microbacterium aurum]